MRSDDRKKTAWFVPFWTLALCALATPGAEAASASAPFSVTATVLASCTVAAGSLAFGNYAAADASPTDATSTINVTCTNDTSYTVALDGGVTESNVAARAMSDGASHTLPYQIYTDASHATVWGDGTGTSQTQSGTGSGVQQALTAYGRVPQAQFVSAGNYSDTVTVSVSY
jgi:spore coat protein U domain-containing protein, fimbrial subunit CupE1/2/3/6